ncbi:hypothetical protein JL107_06305 [Nakamurella flavida]|uniref:Uncharacterized protein n=1 Tax=Nakamurella flavida TaxID=363630 RepID=A0A938YNE8_9ACTN|nr:hypothetical protein [Nakamurella flavida]MBM9476050.1 hypothetical protein [Nakamurella flavida]MDP9777207.1 hypothetical protein [Nakamurella flavida]
MLSLDDKPAYELSFWCGTCQFLFQRLEGANDTLSLPALTERLTAGLDELDDEVIDAFSMLLPEGDYLPILTSIEPQMRLPAGPGDYFAEEQVATWGVDSFWGLPEYSRTAYYRTFQTTVTHQAHLYEFVVPMLPPAWSDKAVVAEHAARLFTSSTPTAVAVSTLDVCAPAVDGRSEDYYEHWGLTHFLLDGHHKLQAAAQTGRPLRLLSLLSIDASLASREQLARVPGLRSQQVATRPLRA